MDFKEYMKEIETATGEPLKRDQLLTYAAADDNITFDQYTDLFEVSEFMKSYEEENGPYY